MKITHDYAARIDYNSAAAEALTSLIIQINRRYGIAGAGIRITGTPTKDGRYQAK